MSCKPTRNPVCRGRPLRRSATSLPLGGQLSAALVGDLEQQLALPKVLGFNGKRFRFLGALMIFVGGHDRHSTKKVPTGG